MLEDTQSNRTWWLSSDTYCLPLIIRHLLPVIYCEPSLVTQQRFSRLSTSPATLAIREYLDVWEDLLEMGYEHF